MPIQAFIDDSGVVGTDPVIVLAGQFASAVMWAEFSDAWAEALAEPPSIRRFKMKEAVKREGPFYTLTVQQRNDKLYRLARVISRFGFPAIHCTTTVGDFQNIATAPKPFSDPHFMPFQIMMYSIAVDLKSHGHARRFDVFFDEHRIYSPRVKHWYPLIKEVIRLVHPDVFDLLPVEPHFTTDDEEMPLQAADMLAWFFRRRAPGANVEAAEFDWLLPSLMTMPVSEFSSVFVGQQWRGRFEEQYPTSVIEKVAKFYDELYG